MPLDRVGGRWCRQVDTANIRMVFACKIFLAHCQPFFLSKTCLEDFGLQLHEHPVPLYYSHIKINNQHMTKTHFGHNLFRTIINKKSYALFLDL